MTPNEWSLYPLDCLFDEYQDDFATEVIEKQFKLGEPILIK
jgi:hypothetical protein